MNACQLPEIASPTPGLPVWKRRGLTTISSALVGLIALPARHARIASFDVQQPCCRTAVLMIRRVSRRSLYRSRGCCVFASRSSIQCHAPGSPHNPAGTGHRPLLNSPVPAVDLPSHPRPSRTAHRCETGKMQRQQPLPHCRCRDQKRANAPAHWRAGSALRATAD